MDRLMLVRLGRPDLVQGSVEVTGGGANGSSVGIGGALTVDTPIIGQIGLTYLGIAVVSIAAFYILTRSRQY